MLRTHAQTAGCSLTAQQPLNNVVRVAMQALAGVLGGVQSLHTNSMDETLALPTEEAVMVALRTQQIIAEESGVTNTVDPLGGSYAIEALTDRIEREALRLHRAHRRAGRHGPRHRARLSRRRRSPRRPYRFQQQLDRGEKVDGRRQPLPDADEEPPIELLRDRRRGRGARRSARVRRVQGGARRRARRASALARVRDACRERREPDAAADRGGEGRRARVGEISDVYRECSACTATRRGCEA